MNEDEFPMQQPESSDVPEEIDTSESAFLDKHEFNPPKEGYVVAKGTRIKRKLGEYAKSVHFKFYNSQGEYATPSHGMWGDMVDVPMPENIPRGQNAAVWRYKSIKDDISDWYNSGYFYIADAAKMTYPAGNSAVIRNNNDFSGTGDYEYGATVQLRRVSDNANLSAWVAVQSNGRWTIPISLPFGIYDVYLAGYGQYWQVESRSANVTLDVSWPPTVASPLDSAAVISPSFVISGKALPNAKVHLHIPGGEVVEEQIPVDGNGHWATVISNRTNTELKFVTQQTSNGITSNHSTAAHTVYLVGKPIITRPQDGIVLTPKPTITGTGCPGAKIQIVEGGVGNHVFGEGVVAANGSWSVTITTALPERPINLTCNQTLQSVVSVWADSHQFSVLSAPVVANPGLVDVLPTLTGTHSTGVPGIQIDIYRDLSDEKIGQGVTGANGAWSATITTALVPGVARVTALLRFYSNASTRSAPVALTVRPAPPVITQIIHSGTTTIFKGTGFPGATIEIHPGSGTQNATALVNSQGYFETTPITIKPGTTGSDWGARQKIANGSAWIFSIYHPDAPVFDVPTPVPTVNTPTLIGQIPTVTGRGSVWQGLAAATIVVEFIGTTTVTLSPATVTATGDWTATTATAVAPGSYTVSVRQLMNGVYSLPVTAPEPLIIKPLAPTISSVVLEDFSPRIKGTCWPGASLSLTYTGETTHSFSSADGNWEFRRDSKFKPGKHSFSVIQTFGGQDSVAADPETFTVETPKPVITFPDKQQETDFRPEIKGTNGYEGATVAVFDNKVEGPALGQTIVPASGVWTVSLSKDLTLGEHDIYALQTFETQASERSVSVRFAVKVPKPLLTPVPNNYYPRRSTFSGTGWPGAAVKLSFDGVDYPVTGGIKVDANGQWSALVFLEQLGGKTLKITQTYGGGDGESVNYAFVTVTNAPTIESPSAGEWVDPLSMVVSGYTHPGDTVVVRRLGAGAGDNLGAFLADSEGRWSGTVKKIEGDTNYSYWAYSTKGSFGGDPSDTAVVNLQDLTAPLITNPSGGEVVVSRVVFSGRGLPGGTIQVADLFNPSINHAPMTTVDQSGKWSVEGNTDLAPGPNWVVVQQTSGERKSPWVRSGRFIIEEPPTGFSAPTLDRPSPGEKVGLEPMLAGSGVVGALVYVRHNGKELQQVRVDEKGRWAMRLPAFAVGVKTLTVLQARYGVWSAELKPNPTFNVVQVSADFAAPAIDSPLTGATVDRRFWISGKGIPGARVNVHKSGDGTTVYATAVVDAYGDWCACINRELPVDDFHFTAQQILDGKASLYFAPTVVVKVADIVPVTMLESHSNGEQVAPVMLLKGRGFPGATLNVYQLRDHSTSWGTAKVDTQGYWEVVTKPLPLGKISLNVAQFSSPGSSWGRDYEFEVVNAG
ncbi:hypothetical protein [Pseudomonas rustica]|uniref:hypothetical protein n=1 Tax=Pseudomonas rustica TaxID=2827099 RepID=UPI001BB03663|nr:hypothetical protein [Pseudomonas rustica]MBS4089663.1 hypothetical protein [Pseudomonas rustica]